jgi:hypothetical protein
VLVVTDVLPSPALSAPAHNKKSVSVSNSLIASQGAVLNQTQILVLSNKTIMFSRKQNITDRLATRLRVLRQVIAASS